ncbi:hypothetical protein KAR91_21400 [Candidatus Pacearchaeota archaeon]|nr:hypothetical protein [Candidatus Pacearchaeota archaeon]
MRHRILKLLLWLARKLDKRPPCEFEIQRLNGKVILPDELSGDIIAMKIDFEEPISPAKIMENLTCELDVKHQLPDRTFTLYHANIYEV